MPPRTAVVEDFDDDTDLPLPARPLPALPRGALLEEIVPSDDDDDSDDLDQSEAGPASPPNVQFRPTSKPPSNTVTDITPYKTYLFPFPPCFLSSHIQMDVYISDIH